MKIYIHHFSLNLHTIKNTLNIFYGSSVAKSANSSELGQWLLSNVLNCLRYFANNTRWSDSTLRRWRHSSTCQFGQNSCGRMGQCQPYHARLHLEWKRSVKKWWGWISSLTPRRPGYPWQLATFNSSHPGFRRSAHSTHGPL